jgi:hypothetical protein
MDSKNKITVFQDGNPRGKDISQEEIKQGITDMAGWFSTHAKDIFGTLKSTKPASADELKALADALKSTLPESIKVLYSVYNGNFLLSDNFKSLPIQRIIDDLEVCSVYGGWKKNYIPFALDEDNNYLCLEHNNGVEVKIVSWCQDIGVIEEVADSLGLLIEKIRNGLLKKQIQYIEGAGLVEGSI